jgi:HSP20 family protein
MSLIPWKSKQKEGAVREESPLAAFRAEMDRLLDAYVREPLASFEWPFGASGAWEPAVDVSEDDKQFTVRAEVPGIDPGDVEVTISGNHLIISGEKKESAERSGRDFHVRESRYGSFRRVVPLPGAVDAGQVYANCADGVLTVSLKKSQAAAAKRIEVKVQGDQPPQGG